jgi:hypothetical protein
MRFTTRQELIQRIEKEHQAFVELAASIPKTRYREEGVWGEGWNIQDLFAHLTEWQQMFLSWYRKGLQGENPAVPAPGFKWSQTPELNRAIWRKHHGKSVKKTLGEFDVSYKEVLSVAHDVSPEELFTPRYFAWTKQSLLATYLAANTSSHYSTATKYLKRWLRRQKSRE